MPIIQTLLIEKCAICGDLGGCEGVGALRSAHHLGAEMPSLLSIYSKVMRSAGKLHSCQGWWHGTPGGSECMLWPAAHSRLPAAYGSPPKLHPAQHNCSFISSRMNNVVAGHLDQWQL